MNYLLINLAELQPRNTQGCVCLVDRFGDDCIHLCEHDSASPHLHKGACSDNVCANCHCECKLLGRQGTQSGQESEHGSDYGCESLSCRTACIGAGWRSLVVDQTLISCATSLCLQQQRKILQMTKEVRHSSTKLLHPKLNSNTRRKETLNEK